MEQGELYLPGLRSSLAVPALDLASCLEFKSPALRDFLPLAGRVAGTNSGFAR
jgi:hypothetical protein